MRSSSGTFGQPQSAMHLPWVKILGQQGQAEATKHARNRSTDCRICVRN